MEKLFLGRLVDLELARAPILSDKILVLVVSTYKQ
jgi:hypothetical protein